MNDKLKRKNKIASREDLISFFKKGRLPTEEHFEKLINSNFNKADDLLDISAEDGFMVYPTDQGKLLSFYQNKDEENPDYTISITPDKSYPKGIFIKEQRKNSGNHQYKETKNNEPEFFITKGSGNIGVGKNNPKQKLDVNGLIASQGRVGNFVEGDFPTDGKWHNVFAEDLTDVNAFEVMAYAKGKRSEGKYSLLHAIAICTFAKSKISKTYSYFKSSSDKINIRWVSRPSKIKEGEKGYIQKKKLIFIKIIDWFVNYYKDKIEIDKVNPKYNLQLRTMSHYGENKGEEDDLKLFYQLSALWLPEFKSRDFLLKEKKEAKKLEIQEAEEFKKRKEKSLERIKDLDTINEKKDKKQTQILKEIEADLNSFIKKEKKLIVLRKELNTISDETLDYANYLLEHLEAKNKKE